MGLGIRFRLGLAVDRARAIVSVPLECEPRASNADVSARVSPRESVRFEVGGRAALICYGRPAARGRRVFGDLVPYGELWRLGANEPTVLHLPFVADVAGIRVRRGKLALYAVPDATSWTIVLNRSTRQWGLTRPERGRDGVLYNNAYNAAVQRAELGRARVVVSAVPHVEDFTVRAEVVDSSRTLLFFEWETAQVAVPVSV
jgi:hypothetical protein